MDPVTHFCSGIVGRNYLTNRRDLKSAIVYGLVSMSPDLDNFVGLFSTPFMYLLHHRGFTHSFVGGFLLSLLLLLLAKTIRYNDVNLLKNFYILILIHIFLDVMTNYGTQIFLPFSNTRVGLDAMFIIDPIFLILIITLYFMGKKNQKSALIAFSLIFLYPFSSYIIKTIYETYLNRIEKSYTVTTAPFSPLFWKVIKTEDYSIKMKLTFNGKSYEYEKVTENILNLLKHDENLKIFKWFLKYPYMKRNGSKYEIADLRFEIPFRHNPFVLIIEEDRNRIKYYFRNYEKEIPLIIEGPRKISY
ncbi:MAG: metal-dependent hydrolase [Calditerrivibrio sp.]|nr:metal-dependent hydrolase [Calditerrivibrio sp.]